MTDMTREEAIEWFRSNAFYHKDHEPFNMAIKALEQEPCEDCISRAEAIRIASGYCHWTNIPDELAKLPSVTPKPKTDVLDKIRAEIKEESRFCPFTEGLERALEIIDKHIAERGTE